MAKGIWSMEPRASHQPSAISHQPSAISHQPSAMTLNRFSKFLVACTVVLILAGSLVTSHDAGLSVPDWPTPYGWSIFTFPPSMWGADLLYEHGHGLIPRPGGFLPILLAASVRIPHPGTS